MLALFYRPDSPDSVVGTAIWRSGDIPVKADDRPIEESIRRIFRRTPVVIEDPSMRSYGTSGPVQLPPGSLRWFRAAAEARAPEAGLAVRFVPEVRGAMGWDPAGAYRTFSDQIERMESLGGAEGTAPVQPGEAVTGAAAQS